ncbi:MAG TPA: hypothetical protein PK156_45750 [Polyangium sp.]|nr:hypothetical protein [Polyangium sp.]
MNKKLMGLLFVVTTAGCHPSPEGAVCPSPEEDVSEPEATSEEEPLAVPQKISEEELERARQHTRRSRFLPSR